MGKMCVGVGDGKMCVGVGDGKMCGGVGKGVLHGEGRVWVRVRMGGLMGVNMGTTTQQVGI